jgi:hypothetical protein
MVGLPLSFFLFFCIVVTNLLCVPKKRNLSIVWGLKKRAWKDIRTLEWKWKRDGTPVPLEMVRSLVQEEGVDPYHLDLVLLSLFCYEDRVGFVYCPYQIK